MTVKAPAGPPARRRRHRRLSTRAQARRERKQAARAAHLARVRADAAAPFFRALDLPDKPSLPSDADFAYARCVGAFADRAARAVAWLRAARAVAGYTSVADAQAAARAATIRAAGGAAPDVPSAIAGDGPYSMDALRLRAGLQEANRAAASLRTMHDHAVQPMDVRIASGLPITPAIAMFDAARAMWHATAAYLPAAERAGIEAACPLPRRPANLSGLVRRAKDLAPKINTADVPPPLLVIARPVEPECNPLANDRGRGRDYQESLARGPAPDDGDADARNVNYYVRNIRAGKFARVGGGRDGVGWMLPGTGMPRDDCGKLVIVKTCDNEDAHAAAGLPDHAPALAIPQSCDRLACPLDFVRSIDQRAAAVTDRIMGCVAARAVGAIGEGRARRWQPLQAVLSPPPALHEKCKTSDGIKELNSTVSDIMESLNLEGGALMFHPWRLNDSESMYFSPHFHLVGLGYLAMSKVKEVHERTGWVVKFVRSLPTRQDVYNVVWYLHTHVGLGMVDVATNKKTPDVVRYFGIAGTRKFGCATAAGAQRDLPGGLANALRGAMRGKKNPAIPPELLQVAGDPAGTPKGPPPEAERIVRVRQLAFEDKAGEPGANGVPRTIAEFGSLHVQADYGRRRVRDHHGTEGLLKEVGCNARYDYPAKPEINGRDVGPDGAVPDAAVDRATGGNGLSVTGRDVGPDGAVPDAAVDRATGAGRRVPADRMLVVEIETPAPAGGGAAGAPAGTLDAVGQTNKRVMVIILHGRLNDLCVICREPLKMAVYDENAPLNDQHAPHNLPLNRQCVVHRGLYRRPLDPSEYGCRYDAQSGARAVRTGMFELPPRVDAYTEYLQSMFVETVGRSQVAFDYCRNENRRPTEAELDAEYQRRGRHDPKARSEIAGELCKKGCKPPTKMMDPDYEFKIDAEYQRRGRHDPKARSEILNDFLMMGHEPTELEMDDEYVRRRRLVAPAIAAGRGGAVR